MLDVLIIDDEPNVRKGLKIIVPWEENGFKICGDSGDADEGLEKIFNLNPNIVLLDIKMPGKLGIDVIREAREKGYKGKFIIVSGYSNFEYAKDAIKYGAKSYILKPIDEDELMEILLELKKEINDENRWEKDKKVIEEINLKNLFIEGSMEESGRYSQYENFQVAIVDSEVINLEKNVKTALNVYSEEIDIIKIDSYIVLLFKGFKNIRVNRTLQDLFEKIIKEIGRNIFITIGNEVRKSIDIHKSYKEAERLMKQKFLHLEKGIISSNIDEEEKNDKGEKEGFDIEKIYSYVEVNDLEQLKISFEKIENYLKQNNYSEDKIKIMAIRIFLELKEKLVKDYNLEENLIVDKEQIIEEIYLQNSLKELMSYLLENFTIFSNKIADNSSDNIIKRMTNYINKNYYKDLKLEGLSEIFNYNSAYLGKLFKSATGENFNTYVDKIRIEKAKVFLTEEKLKVYQVSEKVGYKNIDYFHSKFKKYVGTSPLNYKKLNDK
ncbi:response regulator [Clostridium beijerinckii]|uniref:response regulator n=1 Tax=Clostridium beijerinckii TaxID=1520 RepID=UPI0014944CE7|nr:response regulator [Clostridium beijerinckii]NOW06629.1 two-component system response regulator YesN [Clostridium beijerinckii]NYC00227.1 two-component system response regulator YesN [Clostridium beijerinckii]